MKGEIKGWFASLMMVFLIAGCGEGNKGSGGLPSAQYTEMDGISASPQEGNSSSEPGVTITEEVPFSKETLEEIKERESRKPTPIPEQRVIPFHKEPPPEELPPEQETPPQETGPEAPTPGKTPESSLAPVLSNNFIGLDDNNTAIPPDTHGAIGPSHLMETLNSEVAIFSKSTGAIISRVSLQGFWASLGTASGQAASDPFDPKVIYDQHSGRFIVVTLGGSQSPDSWLMIGVSATADPTGTFYKWAIDADKDGGVQSFNNWADYPGIGVDANYVYITANMLSTGGSSSLYPKVWVIPKAQLLTGSSSITLTEFRNPTGSGSTLQPAHTFGTSSAEYIIRQGEYISGTPPRRLLRLAKITFSSGSPSWTDMGYIEVTSYPISALPLAPQLGNTNLIDTGDTRLLNAVFRNGFIWTTHHVANDANTKTEAGWYQIDPAKASPSSPYGTPTQQGRISDTSRWYYYPSIAVNSNGDVGIGFSGSSSSEYAGAYYTARRSSDTANTMQSVAVLKAGLAPYFKTFDGTENRWGDYSATSIDPEDDLAFWTMQEYASTPVAGSDRWGTWWNRFTFYGPAAPSGLSASSASSSQIDLSWADNSSDETGFKIERKTGSDGTYSEVATVAANTTSYSDAGFNEGTTYYYRIRSYTASGNSNYSDEANATTSPVAPSNLSASMASSAPSSQIDLRWTDNSSIETGFKVERKTGTDGTYSEIATVTSNTTTYSDTGLSEGTTYYYRIRSYSISGNSSYSAEASATTQSIPSGGGGGGGGCGMIRSDNGKGPRPPDAGLLFLLILPFFMHLWRRMRVRGLYEADI